MTHKQTQMQFPTTFQRWNGIFAFLLLLVTVSNASYNTYKNISITSDHLGHTDDYKLYLSKEGTDTRYFDGDKNKLQLLHASPKDYYGNCWQGRFTHIDIPKESIVTYYKSKGKPSINENVEIRTKDGLTKVATLRIEFCQRALMDGEWIYDVDTHTIAKIVAEMADTLLVVKELVPKSELVKRWQEDDKKADCWNRIPNKHHPAWMTKVMTLVLRKSPPRRKIPKRSLGKK